MDTQVSLLNGLAYVPSYKPKSPKPIPKLLEDKDVWNQLITDIWEYMETSRSVKWNQGVFKPFVIKLFDTMEPSDTKV